ncbi:response regulator [Duganella sp. Root336D2]|uniref:response regulator n=1 Tax=Duganella sp. Root336D2 TaxID=1736518 RepID=UPI0006FD7620|nr:response regulator [Duganella sp. Root336D2]KQV42910.1 two-component system sensor histidine kinase/response regulator [Duganella sp. Root336D2]
MQRSSTIDDQGFRRILNRNVKIPLLGGIVAAGIFVVLFAYLMSTWSAVESTERAIGNAQELRKLAVDMESGMRGYLLTGDDAFLTPYVAARPRFEAATDFLSNIVSDDSTQVERLKHIRAQHQAWLRAAEQMIAARRQQGDYLGMVRAGMGKIPFDGLREQFRAFIEHEERQRATRGEAVRVVGFWTVAIFLAVSLTVSCLLAWLGRRDLLRLSAVYRDALQEQHTHAYQLQHQAWLREGQSQLAEQGIGQMTLPLLSSTLLQFMARYLDVAVASFYVVKPDGSLERTAAYGFSQEDEARGRQLLPGEGLVGQAARSRRAVHLGQLPEGYIKVTSSLGDGMPHQLVLVPVHSDGRVNGVVELGFMREAGRRELDFLELVAANIGMAIEATVARQRLGEVLVETQSLNEEMQVQQEELRTANEELEEQSRVLERSRTSLEMQKLELEQSNEKLATQAEMLDQRNAALAAARVDVEARARDLERASEYKSQFLANMSHELRTPLNSSLILAKLLADNAQGNLDEEQVRFAQTIYNAGNDLLALINDILDISKVEAGKLELAPEDVVLQLMIDNLQAVFAPLAQEKHLEFVIDLLPGLPEKIYTDRQRLEQILKNLLSNAVKFTDRGKVILRVSPGEAGLLRFAVIDTGVGVRAEQQGAIFDAFQQGDGTPSRRFGGTGLGLSISRDLARLLGGEVELSSVEGQGSTFTLLLPTQWAVAAPQDELPSSTVFSVPSAMPADPPPASDPLPAADGAGNALRPFEDDRSAAAPPERKVLIIEDDPAFARILYDLAHEASYRALAAFTAEEGLQLAQEQQPQAVMLDIRLPDRSGLSVLQMLKDNPQTRHIPVHVISGTDNGEAALHLGAVGYVRKPAGREELLAAFDRLERRFTQKIKHILLVEDDERQRESMVKLIEDEDIDITAVASGAEALEQLRATVFDCMVMDLKLPDMQGSELLQQMSQQEIASFPPVIVYTGRNMTRAEETELSKYSRSIIIKGARSPERLLDEVTLFLHKVESQLSSERQTMLKAVRSRDRVFEGRRILLVDDDVRNIFSLTSAIEQKGALVEIARNGHEALDKLDTVPDIDLVLMDIMMPGMDGLEATRRLRADPRFVRMPVIAITAKAMKDDQEQCLAAGANDYLAKPIDLSRLYSLLRVWMPAMDTV